MSIYWKLFFSCFKIGFFTIGGGYAMIPLIEQEFVVHKKWISKKDFIDILALAQSAPGVLAVNVSIFIGYRIKGVLGSIVTTLGSALPSFLIILAIVLFFGNFKENQTIQSIFKGIRPAVVALIAVPVFRIAKTAKINYKNSVIPLATALFIWRLAISPIWIILIIGVGSFIYGRFIKNTTNDLS